MNKANGAQGFNLNQLISDRYSELTKSEKIIANFIRKNQEEAAFLSAGEISERLNLSEATIVRFARKLDFESFPAMRAALQDNFRRRVTHSSRLRDRLQDMVSDGDILERLTATEIDYLSQAVLSIDRNEMKQAVDLLRQHQRIFVFGLGPSIPLVGLMELRLRRFGKDIIPLISSGRELIESLITLQSTDLVFVICFFDQNPALQLLLDYSRQAGCKTIIVTDTLGSILDDCVDVVLAAQRGPVGEFHSLVVPMTVINALLLTYASEEQDQIMPLLDKLDALREKLNRFTSKRNG
ncbi:MAG TPA: MurR/RpiR family transcriptional regulator [Brevefilum sp.]|nr:MurR/RpiR family transcriptional regulator [Brevefilum sp.]HOR18609.1 MurR/RpiR family transcriptional regulator [Brevefilum sp.]HPL68996.1 MurR/RpiR family transcriptional regulator [Brevefilum sp.]